MRKILALALVLVFFCTPVFAWETAAEQITTYTDNFDGNLSSADFTAQRAFDTIDDLVLGAPIEGTAVLSTGEGGGNKFLREDGDGTSSWQVVAGGAHDAATLDVNAETLLSLTGQEFGLDTQTANKIFGGPASGGVAVPTFRSLVDDDIPDDITTQVLGDIVTTAPLLIDGGANVDDILPGANVDRTFSITVAKDLVAGVGLSGGEDNVLPGADADTTFTFAPTELTNFTWSAGASASIAHTYDVSGTDVTATWGSNLLTLSGSLTLGTGKNFLIGTTQWNSGDNIDGAKVVIALGGGSPTVDQLQEYLDNTGSSGFFLGGAISDGGSGTVDVAAGSGFIRTTNDDNAQLESFKWSASAGIAVTDNTTQYIYVDDAGAISLSTSEFLEAPDKIKIGVVTDEGAAIESTFSLGVRLQESIGEAGRYIRNVHGIARNKRFGGLIFGQSGDANRDVTMTAGQLEWGRTSYSISAFNTSGADTFATYSAGGSEDAVASQWPNTQYDSAGTLTTLSNNSKWANLFFWLEPDDNIVMMYGREEFSSEALADEEKVPSTSLPSRVSETGILVARYTFQKSANTATISSAFDQLFANQSTSDHTTLANLAFTSSGHTGTATRLFGTDGTGAAAEYTLSGTGTVIPTTTSPTLVTPALGTPSALVGTNISGTGAGFTAGTVTNATFNTALTVSTGTVSLVGNVANNSVLTLGAGASSISGSNTGDQSAGDFNHDDTANITGTAGQYNHPTDANMTVIGNTSNTNTGDEVAASTSTAGVVELAIASEIDTGTDSTRAMPVDQFVASKRNIRLLAFNLVEAATDNATATNIAGDFVSPIAGTVLQSDTAPYYIYTTNSTAGTTGTMVVDISFGGTTIMGTNKLDTATGQKNSYTSSTHPDLTDTTLAVGDIITIDIDAIHTTAAKGLTVYMAIRE